MKHKKMITGDFIDPETGLRFVEDERGNYHLVNEHPEMQHGEKEIHVHIPEINVPPSQVRVEVIPSQDDPEKQRLLRVTEALRRENNWLWEIIMNAIIDRRKKNANKAMDDLEQKIKDRQRA